jgi:RNA polymerase sigma factor (sigma-70 family)
MLMTESDALRHYADSRSSDAFAQLVALHADWVYAAAARLVRDRQLAEDVTQAVFLLLAEHPHKVAGKSLTGWLFNVTRHCAAHALRAESRRAAHERRAATMTPESPPDPDEVWNDLSPNLERAVSRLREADRQLVLLRFYQNHSLAQIGQSLNISEDTARKRVGAAVERLRSLLKVTGVPAVALTVLLAARTAPAAPIALKASLCAGAVAPSAATITLAHGAAKMILFSQAKFAAAVVTSAVLLTGVGFLVVRSSLAAAPSPSAPPTAAPPSAPAVAATKPDLSTPQAAYLSAMAALRQGDRAALYRCLTADPARAPLPIDAALSWNLALNHLFAAADKRFGPQASTPLRGGAVTIDMIGDLFASALGPAAVLKNPTPDTAELSIDVPPELLDRLPVDWKPTVQKWSGRPMRFVKQGDQWKFDIDHSMQVESDLAPAGKTTAENNQLITTMLEQIARGTDNVATDIADGKITTVLLAGQQSTAATDGATESHGLTHFDFHILPYAPESAMP